MCVCSSRKIRISSTEVVRFLSDRSAFAARPQADYINVCRALGQSGGVQLQGTIKVWDNSQKICGFFIFDSL